MVVNDIPENRAELDRVERVLALDKRRELLRRLGSSKLNGLLCWAFGAGWEARSLDELPTSKICEFVSLYV